MVKLEYSPVALEKLGAIHRYITEELKNPTGANNTLESIYKKIQILKEMPKIGAPLTSRCSEVPGSLTDVRVLPCGSYIVLYLFNGSAVKILRLYNTKEDYIRHLFGATTEFSGTA